MATKVASTQDIKDAWRSRRLMRALDRSQTAGGWWTPFMSVT